AILEAATLQRVEDLYRPHRPKRRTRAGVAKEQGLEPLAQWLLSRPRGSGADIEERAASFTDPEKSVPDASAALAGARDITAEHVADDPEVRAWLRSWTWANGTLKSRAVDPEAQTPFEHYYEYSEAVSRIRPHRVLAIDRGEREEALRVRIEVEKEAALEWLRRRVIGKGAPPSPADPHLAAAVEDAYARLLAPAVERDVRGRLTETAHEQAIEVFAANLRSLLLAPPLRGRVVMGFDPAYRTGCKLAVVDPTGR